MANFIATTSEQKETFHSADDDISPKQWASACAYPTTTAGLKANFPQCTTHTTGASKTTS